MAADEYLGSAPARSCGQNGGEMTRQLRKSGIKHVGEVAWGSHFLLLFETKERLLAALASYFASGLAAGELCIWLIPEPLTVAEASSALRRAVPDLDLYLQDGSIEIELAEEWCRKRRITDLEDMTRAWDAAIRRAAQTGFEGVRFCGWPSWLSGCDWRDLRAMFDESIAGKRLLVLSPFPTEVAELQQAKDEIRELHEELERRIAERTAQTELVNAELRARNRQLSAVAALGQAAIHARDLDLFMTEAALVAAQTLGTELSAILQVLADEEDQVLMRAGVGWNDGVVGHLRSPAGPDTLTGFVLRSGSPIVIPDVSHEPRFRNRRILVDHSITSVMAVVIRGRDRPWGAVAVQTREARAFTPDDVEFLQSVSNIFALVIERHELELAQRKEKETLETIFDNTPVMISFFDASGRLLRVNRTWEEKMGWTLAEAQKMDVLAQAYPDPEYRRGVLDFIARAERRWADFRPRTRSGKFMDTTWARFRLSDGSAIGFGIDVTESRQALEALAESEARFAKIFHASPVALGMSTLEEGRILDVNQSWLDLFGYLRHEVIGRTNAELSIIRDQGLRREVIARLRAEGGLRNVEVQVRQRSGELRDLIVSIVNIDLLGPAGCALSALVDITERKRVEAERDQLLEREQLARSEAEGALDRLRAVESITDSALAQLDLDELLRELLSRVRHALGVDSALVMLLDEEGRTLFARAIEGLSHERVASIRVPVGTGVTGRIAAEGRPLIVNDYSTVDTSGIEGVSPSNLRVLLSSAMGVPLRIGPKVVGVVAVSSSRPRRFTEEELTLLLLVADRVGPSIERARLVERVHAGRQRLKALSTRLLKAQEEERRRLSIELHDELGQVLTAVKINLETVQRTTGASMSAHLADAISSVVRAMETVRDLALNLRPSVLDDLGLPAALRCYASRFLRDTGIDVHFSIEGEPRLEPALETAFFRVAQEALTNVARHAQARNVWLDLHLAAESLGLTVRDDGIGFNVDAAWERAIGGASLGLLGMDERVSLLGGRLEVRSSPGSGTEVVAHFRDRR
jgi:PAS domain S-box-containing protein